MDEEILSVFRDVFLVWLLGMFITLMEG